MAGTGNVIAVMDAMGHSWMDMRRIYQHLGLRQATEAIEKTQPAEGAVVQ